MSEQPDILEIEGRAKIHPSSTVVDERWEYQDTYICDHEVKDASEVNHPVLFCRQTLTYDTKAGNRKTVVARPLMFFDTEAQMLQTIEAWEMIEAPHE